MEHLSGPLARVLSQARDLRLSRMTPAEKSGEALMNYLRNPTKQNLGMFVALSGQADQAEIDNARRAKQHSQLSEAPANTPTARSG